MYISFSTAQKDIIRRTSLITDDPDRTEIRTRWFYNLRAFLEKFLWAGVTPVFVFDGKPPQEKEEERATRREKKEKVLTEIRSIRESVRDDPLADFANTNQRLEKLFLGIVIISKEDTDIFRQVLTGIGIPWLQSKGEGEELCTSLYSYGYVSGIYSTDSDVLTHGGGILINGFDRQGNFECVHLEKILPDLGITFSQFVDMCILGGCDYNRHGTICGIRGISTKTAYKLILKHGSIDGLPSTYEVGLLNHLRAQEIFRIKSPDETYEGDEDDDKFSIEKITLKRDSLPLYARDTLTPYGIDDWIEHLSAIYSTFPEAIERGYLNPIFPGARVSISIV